MSKVGDKKCGACEVDMHISMFYKSTASKDGHQARCKECMNHYNKERQGMKRAETREIKDMIETSALGFEVGLRELVAKYEAEVVALSMRHAKNSVDAVRQFNALRKGERYETDNEKESGTEDISVRGAIAESLSHSGQESREGSPVPDQIRS